MKKLKLIGVILLFLSGAIFGQSLTVTYDFKNPKVIIQKDGYSKILYENCKNFGDEGYPSLPHSSVNLLLPQGQEIKSIRIISSTYYPMKKGIKIEPAQREFPLSQKPKNEYKVIPNAEIYNSTQPYPEKIIVDISTHFLAGHSIGSFTICPVNYIPANDQVEFLQNITFEVKTHSTQKALSAELFLKSSPGIIKRLDRISENPGNFAYTYPQHKDFNEYDILLITNNALLSAFGTYVEFKTETGYIVKTMTVEDIYSQYSGNDNQDKIRNCVIDYYQNYNISYVILGGDSDPNNAPDYIIPHRGFYANAYGTTDSDIPADIYYSNLDGNWNNDGDGNWGESGEDDLYSEVSIGRICVDNTTEIQNFTHKLFMYQNNPVIGDIEKTLMLGELLWDDPTWGGDYKDEVAYGSSMHGYTTAGVSANFSITRLYEKLASWDKNDVFDQFNNTGVNLLNHLGHSNTGYNMLMYNSDLTTSNFQNNGISRGYVIGYSQGCYNGSFDNRGSGGSYGSDDCFAEKITTLSTAEVASIGNSRYGWGMHSSTDGSSQYFDRQFYDAIFGEDITNIGDANADSKEDNVSYISVGAIRWCFYELTLFGDPTMDIWTAVPTNIVANYPASVSIGISQITFQTDAPYARIGIMQDGELIGRAVTGADGNVTVSLFEPISQAIPLDISIIAHNRNRHEGNIVIVSDQPYVIYNDYILNDPTGNNNGVADFGEDITLDMTLENVGNQIAYNVTATLICTDPYITLSDNYEVYGTINASSTSTISDAFAFSIADDIPDQHVLNFELQVDGNAEDIWTSYLSIVVNAPLLEFGNMTIDDIVGGNGNGRLDPGETADISVPVSNNGNSNSPVAAAFLTSVSTYVTINSGGIPLGEIESAGSADTFFNITCDPLTPVGTAVDLTVDVTAGNYGINNTFYQSVGLVLEDWETGNFASYPWTFAGTADWFITDVDPYEGIYCSKSGVISHSQTSEMEVELDVTTADDISFYRKVSSESGWDKLFFYIDGAEKGQWSGEVAWSQVSYAVTAGLHTFKWVYYKDGNTSSGSDCGWIDYIIFPPIVPPPDPPDIEVSPLSFEITIPPGAMQTELLSVSNLGETDLEFSAEVAYLDESKNTVTVSPASTPYWTGTTDGSTFTDNSEVRGVDLEDGWFMFDVSSIPVGATINSIEFYGYVNNTYYPYWSMTPVSNNPLTTDAATLYSDINAEATTGYYLYQNESSSFPVGWHNYTLGGTANADLEAAISQGWFAMGMASRDNNTTYYINWDGWNETNPPYLIVDYTYNPLHVWLTVDGGMSTTGLVASGENQDIVVGFDATSVPEDTYFAEIRLSSNDPVEPLVIVPCTLHVGDTGFDVDLTVFLEGPFSDTEMETTLNLLGLIPNEQPYGSNPWYYGGTENVISIPNNDVADWVLLEFRDAPGDVSTATSATIFEYQAAFLLKDGSIVGLDGLSKLTLVNPVNNNLFAVIRHRNHIPIMSSIPIPLSGNLYEYDFTGSETTVYGGATGYVEIAPGIWGMVSGDGLCDGVINMDDKIVVWEIEAGNSGDHSGDFNMNGNIDNKDKNDCWKPNIGSNYQEP